MIFVYLKICFKICIISLIRFFDASCILVSYVNATKASISFSYSHSKLLKETQHLSGGLVEACSLAVLGSMLQIDWLYCICLCLCY